METNLPHPESSASQLAQERVLADLKALAADTRDLLQATAGDLTEKTKEARARVTAALERAKTSYSEMQDQSIESAKAAAKKADETIRANPYQSIGIALVVGLLVGALWRRK